MKVRSGGRWLGLRTAAPEGRKQHGTRRGWGMNFIFWSSESSGLLLFPLEGKLNFNALLVSYVESNVPKFSFGYILADGAKQAYK